MFMENVWLTYSNKKNVKLIHDETKIQRLAAKPTFHTSHIINERLTLVELKPAKIKCNKPIYIGSTVLDLSKHHMYRFYYDFITPMYYDTGLHLIYTDTDSYYIQVFNRPDFYHDLLEHEEYFDRSAYPTYHFLHCEKRKRELGRFKDIHAEGHIMEMIALRSKMYAVKIQALHDHVSHSIDLKAKGVSKTTMKDVDFKSYVTTLQDCQVTKHTFKQIRSFKHHLVTKTTTKVGLCSYDDKRYLLPCGLHSYAYGHLLAKKNAKCPYCTPEMGSDIGI